MRPLGNSIFAGHYFSFVNYESKWYKVDDRTVKTREERMLAQIAKGRNCAYVLLYENINQMLDVC